MTEKESETEPLDKFVKDIKETYEPLNENKKFKEKYKDMNFKILMNPKDGEYAALVTIDKGTITVEGIRNEPKENITKEKLDWDGYIKTTKKIFKDIGDGKLTQKDIITKAITRKVKLKGPKYLIHLNKMRSLSGADVK